MRRLHRPIPNRTNEFAQPHSLPLILNSINVLAQHKRLVSTLLMIAIAISASRSVEAIERDRVSGALRATVQVIVPDNEFENFSLGSGTVMNRSGLILTNHHVVAGERPNGLMNDDGIVGVAITPPDLRGESILKFLGLVVRTDPELDLALVQITGLFDEPDAPLPDNLGLSPIQIGDSNDLMISDEVNMFGYPGIGSNTPTYTKGIVSGFLDDDRDGLYEWIKTDAGLAHGNSGGLATDGSGQFIGVPTAGNTDDVGVIGLVRTGNIAMDFVNSYFPSAGSDGAQVANLRFAEAINRRGEPIHPAIHFDSGISDLYAVFDYSGFADGKTLIYVWYVDGLESERDSFQWDGGASGSSWVSVYSDGGLQEGFTELQLIYDDQTVYRGGIVVGQPTDSRSRPARGNFGTITFAEEVVDGQPVNAGVSFSGLTKIHAIFDYAEMTNGAAWMTRWYVNGQSVLEQEAAWNAGESGSYSVSLTHPDGLPTGDYKLELYIEGDLDESNTFTILDLGKPLARNINVIGSAIDQDNQRTKISGALIIFLKPDVSIDDWIESDFTDDMIHGSGTTNRRGDFQLDATAAPGETYAIAVVHDDYQPITVDEFQIPQDSDDPFELDITMQHK